MRSSRLLLPAGLALVVLFLPFRPLQLIAILYLIVLALSGLYSRLARRCVAVHRADPVLRAWCEEPLEVSLLVENRGPLPIHYLCLLDDPNTFYAAEPGRFLLGLRPFERRRLTYRLESRARGEYRIGPARLLGSDPLGFFPWEKVGADRQSVYVYPRVFPIGLPETGGLPAGNIRVEDRIYEDVTRYRSLREYLPGDDFRRIHWKASARLGRLHSVEYLPVLYTPVLILLDFNRDAYPVRYRQHRLERAASLAASLVVHFLDRRQEIGFLASAAVGEGKGLPAAGIRGSGEQATAILEMLARLEPVSGGEDPVRLLARSGMEVPFRTRIEVIAPLLGPESREVLRGLRRKGCTVEIFLPGANGDAGRELGREFAVYPVHDHGRELITVPDPLR